MKKLLLITILSHFFIGPLYSMDKVNKPSDKDEWKPKEQSYHTVVIDCRLCKTTNHVLYYPGQVWYNCNHCKKLTLFIDLENKYPNHNKRKD